MTNEDATYGWRKSFKYVAKRQNGVQEQVRILPDPFTAKAVTRDTCLLSGVDARALARIGGDVG